MTHPHDVSRDESGRGFLVEWNGQLFDSLLQIRRGGKRRYLTADGRRLDRARVIGPLIRPGDEQPTTTPADIESSPPPPPAPAPAPAAPPPASVPAPPAEDSHWAASGGAEQRARMLGVRIGPPPSTPTPHEGAVTESEPGVWTGSNHRGGTIVVWKGVPDLAAVDDAIAYQSSVLDNLEALREITVTRMNAPQVTEIDARIGQLAAADGIHDLAEATPEQLAAWRRYAEALEQ